MDSCSLSFTRKRKRHFSGERSCLQTTENVCIPLDLTGANEEPWFQTSSSRTKVLEHLHPRCFPSSLYQFHFFGTECVWKYLLHPSRRAFVRAALMDERTMLPGLRSGHCVRHSSFFHPILTKLILKTHDLKGKSILE